MAPSVDDLSGQIMTWVGLSMRLSRARPMTESLGMLNELGLTMPQIVALHVMAFEGSMTMTRLVERLGLSTSAVSHLLHRLVQMGLCERRDDPADRRQKRVRLTPAGVDVVRRLLKSRLSDTRGSIEPLSAGARSRLSEVLTEIIVELTEQIQAQPQEPSSSASAGGSCGGDVPHSLDDVLHRLESLGDDVAEAAADLGDRVADAVAKKAAAVGDHIVSNVNARVARARRSKQEKT